MADRVINPSVFVLMHSTDLDDGGGAAPGASVGPAEGCEPAVAKKLKTGKVDPDDMMRGAQPEVER